MARNPICIWQKIWPDNGIYVSGWWEPFWVAPRPCPYLTGMRKASEGCSASGLNLNWGRTWKRLCPPFFYWREYYLLPVQFQVFFPLGKHKLMFQKRLYSPTAKSKEVSSWQAYVWQRTSHCNSLSLSVQICTMGIIRTRVTARTERDNL